MENKRKPIIPLMVSSMKKLAENQFPSGFHKIEYKKQEPITLQTSLIILLGGNGIFSYGHKIASELYAYTLFPALFQNSINTLIKV